MALYPERLQFRRDPAATMDTDHIIVLDEDGDRLSQVEWFLDGKLVDFALNHFVLPNHPDNELDCNAEVARIDTCHDEVHQHQFYRSRRPEDYRVIKPLYCLGSLEEAYEVIRSCYDDCYLDMAENWEDHSVRWREG